MKTLPLLLTVALMTIAAGAVEAEAQPPVRVVQTGPLYSIDSDYDYHHDYPSRPSHYHGHRPAYFWHGGATAAGSYARGIAALTHAQGQYNRLTAEARVIDAEAVRLEIDNRQLAADTFFAMRQANQQARAALRKPRPSNTEIAERASKAAPDRLSSGQLDATTGELAWPVLLQTDEYSALRGEMQTVFQQRIAGRGLDRQRAVGAQQTAGAMQQKLKNSIRQVQAADYIEASRFLRSLTYEVQLSVI